MSHPQGPNADRPAGQNAYPSQPVNPGQPGQPIHPGYAAQQAPGAPGTAGAPGAQPPRPMPTPELVQPVALPVTETRYTRFWRTPAWSAGRGWGAVILLGIGFVVSSVVFYLLGMAVDIITGRTDPDTMGLEPQFTPAVYIANNLSLAALIPLSILLAASLFRQRPGFLSSVTGAVRWSWMGVCAGVYAALWVVCTLITIALTDGWSEFGRLQSTPDTLPLIIGILLTTPLQAAGEEYGFRGLINRAFAAMTSSPRPGLILGAIVSSLLFMLAHAAEDMWLNIFYFSFGLITCWLAWRTGGLEAPIAVHVVHNLLSQMFLPWQDLSEVFDRSAGVGDPTVLITGAAPLIAAVIIAKLATRRDLAVESAPGREEHAWQQAQISRMATMVPGAPAPGVPASGAPFSAVPAPGAPARGGAVPGSPVSGVPAPGAPAPGSSVSTGPAPANLAHPAPAAVEPESAGPASAGPASAGPASAGSASAGSASAGSASAGSAHPSSDPESSR